VSPENQSRGTTELSPPGTVAERVRKLAWLHEERRRQQTRVGAELATHMSYVGMADRVTSALESLNRELFQSLLELVESKLTIAVQEVLDQPVVFRAAVDFKRGMSSVRFWIERDGNEEDVYRGQGGSVANVLSVGLRMFALTTQEEAEHRRLLILDEQDCWLRPDLVPALVKIVHEAGQALGFQVIMISHHDTSIFERYADAIYQFEPAPDGTVNVLLR
jgi:hypothetical protein